MRRIDEGERTLTQQNVILHYAFLVRNPRPKVASKLKTNLENDATPICARLNISKGGRRL